MNFLQIIELILGIVMSAGVIVGALWYSFRLGKSKAEEHRIKPFKEAAEGWERLATQQAEELATVKSELANVKNKYEELERDYLAASRTNYRLQGELDQVKSRISELESLKEFFTSAFKEKNPGS